jgi:hypothetical protein
MAHGDTYSMTSLSDDVIDGAPVPVNHREVTGYCREKADTKESDRQTD